MKDYNIELKELNIDFEKHEKTLYINIIDISNFGILDKFYVIINKGLYNYKYNNFYEAILWYRYYISKKRNIKKRIKKDNDKNECVNRNYFSRIPHYYCNTNPEKGLNIIKEVINKFFIHYNGIPEYFNVDELDRLCYLK